MKKQLFFVSLFFSIFFLLGCGTILAQTVKPLSPLEVQKIVQGAKHTLQDFGLSAESVKYLSPQEIRNILNSKTPAETLADQKAWVEKYGTPEQKAALTNPQSANSTLPNTVNCFDYYHFGSVQVRLTAPKSNFNPGDVINFKGPIINQNDYPIVSGTLYVKIFRNRNAVNDANGPDVVDQFIASDNITIPARGEVPVSFSWKVPSSLTTGSYKIASFFIVDKKFNLLGLSFTNDIVGNTFDFQLTGAKGVPQKSDVQFDETGVKINNISYLFASFPPDVPSKNPAVVSAKINNTTKNNETVNIVWKLYKWDGIDPANFIKTVSAKVIVKANSSATTKITITDADYPVYYLVGELTYKDSKSFVDIRFVRPEVDRTRLNFPSIMSFPIKKGDNSIMFSCLHNSGTSDSVPNGKLTLKLTDNSGKTISEYTYQGPVTGEMMAVKKDFTSKNNIDHFFLTAQLWQADKLVDQTKLEYDCKKINPNLCNPRNYNWIIFAILIIIILLAACAAVIIFIKRKK